MPHHKELDAPAGRRGPLDGVVVISLAVNLPGPLAAARLRSFGAEITKVEPPSGDPLAAVAPAWFQELVIGQDIVTLDLKSHHDREQLEELLAGADLLLTAMRPSAFDRLGLGESVRRHGLAHVEIVGHDGADAERPGHDLTYQAQYGTVAAPLMPLVPVADLLGAERAVSAAFAALRAREHGDPGTWRVVLEDAARDAGAAIRHGLTGPGAPLGGTLPGYAIYASADGHVAVAALEPHFAARLREHFGQTQEELTRLFAAQPSKHWEEIGAALDIPIVTVRRAATALIRS